MQARTLLGLCLAVCTAWGTTSGLPTSEQKEPISILYTTENTVTGDDRMFMYTLRMDTTAKPFIEIMEEAALIDPRFQFTTNEHEEHGHYVIEINGLHEDPENGYFWALLKRDDHPDGDCSLHVGISHYIPFDGEHLVFAYETYDLLDRIPECDH